MNYYRVTTRMEQSRKRKLPDTNMEEIEKIYTLRSVDYERESLLTIKILEVAAQFGVPEDIYCRFNCIDLPILEFENKYIVIKDTRSGVYFRMAELLTCHREGNVIVVKDINLKAIKFECSEVSSDLFEETTRHFMTKLQNVINYQQSDSRKIINIEASGSCQVMHTDNINQDSTRVEGRNVTVKSDDLSHHPINPITISTCHGPGSLIPPSVLKHFKSIYFEERQSKMRGQPIMELGPADPYSTLRFKLGNLIVAETTPENGMALCYMPGNTLKFDCDIPVSNEMFLERLNRYMSKFPPAASLACRTKLKLLLQTEILQNIENATGELPQETFGTLQLLGVDTMRITENAPYNQQLGHEQNIPLKRLKVEKLSDISDDQCDVATGEDIIDNDHASLLSQSESLPLSIPLSNGPVNQNIETVRRNANAEVVPGSSFSAIQIPSKNKRVRGGITISRPRNNANNIPTCETVSGISDSAGQLALRPPSSSLSSSSRNKNIVIGEQGSKNRNQTKVAQDISTNANRRWMGSNLTILDDVDNNNTDEIGEDYDDSFFEAPSMNEDAEYTEDCNNNSNETDGQNILATIGVNNDEVILEDNNQNHEQKSLSSTISCSSKTRSHSNKKNANRNQQRYSRARIANNMTGIGGSGDAEQAQSVRQNVEQTVNYNNNNNNRNERHIAISSTNDASVHHVVVPEHQEEQIRNASNDTERILRSRSSRMRYFNLTSSQKTQKRKKKTPKKRGIPNRSKAQPEIDADTTSNDNNALHRQPAEFTANSSAVQRSTSNPHQQVAALYSDWDEIRLADDFFNPSLLPEAPLAPEQGSVLENKPTQPSSSSLQLRENILASSVTTRELANAEMNLNYDRSNFLFK